MKEMKVKVTFIEELLGTCSGNPDIHDEFIASKSPDNKTADEEVEAVRLSVAEQIEKSMTVFPRTEDGKPFIWDYQWRGFFKEACDGLRKVKGMKSEKVTAYKKKVDLNIFVKERKIPLIFDGEVGNCQRPLRAATAQGERIALACSETVPEGATCEFTVVCLIDSDIELVKEWLDYGQWHGMLQWRNSGKGRYLWNELDDKGNVIGGNNV
jgi:hypothetical protein